VSNKDGMFSKERGHNSREKVSVSFKPKYFFVVGGQLYGIVLSV
jgi:hypothetical protein